MATLRTKYKPWLKTEYRGTEIDLPHETSHVVTNPLGEIVGYTSEPRIDGDGWAASGFMYVLGYNADPTRWWESCVTSVHLMDVAAGVLPREAKQQAYRNYWYAGGPICVPTWAQWVAEDKHGNIVAIEGTMRPNVGMYGKWAPKRNQLHVRRDRSGNGWRHSLMNLDHLPTMEQHLPKGFKDELRPLVYRLTELMVPSWVNFITTDPNGDIHGHHTRPSIHWCEHQWMGNTSSIPMCYLGHTQNKGYWKDTLLILEQKESEQKVEKEQNPQRDSNDPVAAEVTKLPYQGEHLLFKPEHKWVATDSDGGVHAFTEKPSRCEESGSRGHWLRESGEKDLLSHDGARNNWGNSLVKVSNIAAKVSNEYKSVHYMKLRYWVPSWVNFISADAHGWLVGHKRKPKAHKYCWQGGGQHFNMGPSVGVLLWQSSLYDVEYDLYIGKIAPDEPKEPTKADQVRAQADAARNGWAPPQPLLCYRGENLTFEHGYNWVATDGLGHVYAFIEEPTVGVPNEFWSCKSGGKILVSRRGARNDWERSLTEIKHLSPNESEDCKSVYYKDIRFWVPDWVYFITADIDNYLRGHQKMPKDGGNIWHYGGRHFNIGIIPAVGVLNWKASLCDVLENKYFGHPIDEIRTQAISDACVAPTEPDQNRAQIKEDLADHPRAKGEILGFSGAFRTINTPPILTSEKLAEIRAYKLAHGNGIPPELLTDEVQRPVHVGVDTGPAESFTMVTFKLPSKTVATQEAMLTDEMFLAGVAFGMRLNKLLSKQGDSDAKEGN